MKKSYLIIVLLFFTLVSCTKVEIVTDSYWPNLVSDFQGSSFSLKFQSFLRGTRLSFTTVEVKNEIPDLVGLRISESDIYLLSPLLSQRVSDFSKETGSSTVYYFGNTSNPLTDITDNMVIIKRDRRKAFFEAGELLKGKLENNYILPVIYSIDTESYREEALSFLDGLNSGEKKVEIISFEVTNTITEAEIRNFFDRNVVKNNKYVVVFSNKWKNMCYEISERDSKHIITSDSWFNKTYAPFILFSVEDDIKGMLNKVYYNAKKKKLDDITLEGYICK